jgi:hypothetical protein
MTKIAGSGSGLGPGMVPLFTVLLLRLTFFLCFKIIEVYAFQLCCCVACVHLSDQVRHSATGEREQDRLVRLNQLNNPPALAAYIYILSSTSDQCLP